MACGCKKKNIDNKEKIEKEKKVREAMRAFLKFKASRGLKLKSGKS
tara:strand:- start:7645 stop:7782 length:138 start_codon:yes stop_codon:yes gene_type:complete